jgi:acyl-CoA synthetase (NDP forming)
MADQQRENLSRMLAPQSIAFIGGSFAAMAIRRSVELGFEGDIWPVNPKLDELEGFPCFKSVDDLPAAPDAAFVGVRRELTIDIVRTLSAMGTGGCVCYAAGFAEIGGDGIELQQQLVEAAAGMPLVGPNCFGFINFAARCALWPYIFGGGPPERGVALVSQSGNIGMNLTMNRRSVRFTHVIGAGNQAVLGPAHYVDALLDDDRVAAIGMYIEGFDDVNAFATAAQRALEKGVPIVVLKVGKTDASAKQSSSHTSSLTGSDKLYDAFFDRLGVVRVDSLNRLLETLKIFDLAGPLTGTNIVSLSCSGGEAAIIADFLPTVGLETLPLSETQVADLEAQFPAWVTVSNPFDYNTSIWGDRKALERCFTASMQGDHDAAFLVSDHPSIDSPEADEWFVAADAFAAAHEATGKPCFIICTVSELLPEAVRNRMLERGVVPLQGLEDGLYAYAAAARYYDRRSERMGSMTLPRPVAELASGRDTALDESESKRQLAAHGLSIPNGKVGSAVDATTIANRIGFPVVVKAVGSNFLHKSDLGAVAVNLADNKAVKQAVAAISASCASHDVVAERFLVERMVESPVAELIVGMKRDEQFGPALVVGSGGILVELVADSRSLLLPVTRDAVRKAIDSLAVSKLINAYRGGVQGDIDALVDAVMSVAAYAEEHWSTLLELDVNPLMVLPAGQGAVAADALIVLRTGA